MITHFSDKDFGISDEFPLGFTRHLDHGDKPLHFHEFVELVIIYHGTAFHLTPEHEVSLRPGDVFVVPKGARHGYSDAINLSLVNVMYDPDRLRLPESDLRRLPGYHALFLLGFDFPHEMMPLHLEQAKLDSIARIVERIEEEVTAEEPGFMAMALAHLSRLIVQLSRYYDAETAGRQPDERIHTRIATAISHIENNLERVVPVTELLELTCLSESSLLRAFKRAVGMGPLEYHNHQRIRRSCHYLRRTDLSITEIAFRVGFNDGNYFTRQFRKHIRMTPTEYRRIPAT